MRMGGLLKTTNWPGYEPHTETNTQWAWRVSKDTAAKLTIGTICFTVLAALYTCDAAKVVHRQIKNRLRG